MNDEVIVHTFWQSLRGTFGRGVIVLLPVVITIWFFNLLFTTVDGIISPVFDQLLYRHIPGLGFVTMLILILMVGVLSRNLIGLAIFKFFERLIFSIPLARTIYSATKDLLNAFGGGKQGRSFREVVLVEYPRPGIHTIGFVTNELSVELDTEPGKMISIYILNPPNPTSGMLILTRRESVKVLDLSVEEGLKLVLSAGIVTPGTIRDKKV